MHLHMTSTGLQIWMFKCLVLHCNLRRKSQINNK
ncbi:hypothetical protein GLYMA_12G002250v4 [Glycine max]|nr:hypothetical protein GLYMA_12G002250v4 [Glycine max]KAH1140889.1 hypothetical protein GYH30_032258 [Glycine max]